MIDEVGSALNWPIPGSTRAPVAEPPAASGDAGERLVGYKSRGPRQQENRHEVVGGNVEADAPERFRIGLVQQAPTIVALRPVRANDHQGIVTIAPPVSP